MPMISVVMPVYNGAKTVGRAIDSILCQSYDDFEFIIIDDGSTDGTRNILEKYSKEDRRIRCIFNRHGGAAAALNRGVAEARGSYIARMDADDFSYPERFKKQMDYMMEHPECQILGSAIRRIEGEHTALMQFPLRDEDIKARLLFSCMMGHNSVFLRRDIWESVPNFYDVNFRCEDFRLWTTIEARFANLPEVLVDYYDGGVSRTKENAKIVAEESCRIMRDQLANRLGIDTAAYSDQWFHSFGEPDEVVDFRQGYELLQTIWEKNQALRVYQPRALRNSLAGQWNHYLWALFFVGGIAGERLPWLPSDGDDFPGDMAIALRTECEGIMETIRIEQAGQQEFLARQRTPGKCIIYGLGSMARVFFTEHFEALEAVLCFSDRDYGNRRLPSAWQKEVIAPSRISSLDYDWVLVSTEQYFGEIADYLVHDCNVPKDRIMSLGWLRYFMKRA